MSGCIAGFAHPLEKSGSGFVDTNTRRLRSAEVWIRGQGHRIIGAAWMAGSFERVYECFLPSILSVLSKKWPLGICAALLRSLHCYGLVLAKGREESPYLQCCQPET